jgi:uncharacterized protein (DUF934 family)
MSEPSPLLAPLRPTSTDARLWKSGAFTADPWRAVADDATIPIDGHAIVSLKRWRAEQLMLAADGRPFGIRVEPADTLDPATDDLERLAVIALAFPKFTDGRAYSTARRLREQWAYRGEVRATGDVLLDQLPLMLRAGFDAFEIVNAPTITALEKAPVPSVSHVYQRSVTARVSDWHSRRKVAVG